MTVPNVTKRTFTAPEKRVAFLAHDGKCAICGCDLEPGWHADHKFAFAKGGKTDLDNCQPLCTSCNLKKGVTSAMPWPESVIGYPPRMWQERAYDTVMRSSKKSVLVKATPGAGKTQFAASVVASKLSMGLGVRVLVVSPSINLRESWADDFSKFGIEIDPDAPVTDPDSADCQGRAVTYASLAWVAGRWGGADVERKRQQLRATIVVLDEIHHAAEAASWGDGLKIACELSPFVLCLSGTPFRSDGNPIPFVTYNEQGEAVADYAYSYAQAIQDNPQVCRQVYFPSYEGDMEWISKDELHRHSFSDELDARGESERLRAALWSEDWVYKQLEDAQIKLSQIRTNHRDAGGLIVAMDQRHAQFLADVMGDVSHSKPLVIASDDKDAHRKLLTFKQGVDPWVIAIKMISEGVNIPRLRVCSYMTNIVTEMFFRQVVGRIVRFTAGIEHQESFMFIPADHRLVRMAMDLRAERILAIQQQPDDEETGEGNGTGREPGSFRLLGAEGRASETISFDGQTFTVAEVAYARDLARPYGIHAEVMARMIRDGLVGGLVNGHQAAPADPVAPLYLRKRQLKGDKKSLNMKSELRSRWLGHIADDRQAFSQINHALNKAVNAPRGNGKTAEQRQKMKRLLEIAVAALGRPSWL